jgi:uncharacterized protein (TIGR00290 family)
LTSLIILSCLQAMNERRPIVLSWSGGKDSALALQALRAQPDWTVVGLLTAVTRDFDRISIHGVRRKLLEAQAGSVGLPLYTIDLEAGSSNASYEAAFRAGLRAVDAAHPDCRHIAFGDLFLEDVRDYRIRLLESTGWAPVFPLWGLPTGTLAERFIDDGFIARLVCVDTTQLDGSFAGMAYSHQMLSALPSTVDPCGERGEFHTFVSTGPGFERSIEYELGEQVLRDDRFMYQELLPR